MKNWNHSLEIKVSKITRVIIKEIGSRRKLPMNSKWNNLFKKSGANDKKFISNYLWTRKLNYFNILSDTKSHKKVRVCGFKVFFVARLSLWFESDRLYYLFYARVLIVIFNMYMCTLKFDNPTLLTGSCIPILIIIKF